MEKLKFKRCTCDGWYCHEAGSLLVLAYVDDLLVVDGETLKKQLIGEL